MPNVRTKYYKVLPAHIETSHTTTRKSANHCIEFKYHLSAWQKIRLLLNNGVLQTLDLMINTTRRYIRHGNDSYDIFYCYSEQTIEKPSSCRWFNMLWLSCDANVRLNQMLNSLNKSVTRLHMPVVGCLLWAHSKQISKGHSLCNSFWYINILEHMLILNKLKFIAMCSNVQNMLLKRCLKGCSLISCIC